MNEPNLAGLRVLVVEDTLLVADVIADELRDGGAEVIGPVSRLKAALQCAREEALDGALLDVNLAGERSFPVAMLLRERGIPFIFLTGYAEDAILPDFRATPCLMKPFKAEEMRELVEANFRPGIRG